MGRRLTAAADIQLYVVKSQFKPIGDEGFVDRHPAVFALDLSAFRAQASPRSLNRRQRRSRPRYFALNIGGKPNSALACRQKRHANCPLMRGRIAARREADLQPLSAHPVVQPAINETDAVSADKLPKRVAQYVLGFWRPAVPLSEVPKCVIDARDSIRGVDHVECGGMPRHSGAPWPRHSRSTSNFSLRKSGAAWVTRTPDPGITNAVLYQLS